MPQKTLGKSMKKVLVFVWCMVIFSPAVAQYYGSLQKLDKARGLNGIKLGTKKKNFPELQLTVMPGNYDWYLNNRENLQLGPAIVNHIFYGFQQDKLQTLQITFDSKNYQALYLFLRGEFGWPEKVERNYQHFAVWPGKKILLVMSRDKLRFMYRNSEVAKAEKWWPDK